MKLYLTEGFDGDKISFFGDFETEDELNKLINDFKSNSKYSYRFNPFETITMTKNGRVIDFGDYHFFLKIEND